MTDPNQPMPDDPGAPESTDEEYISPDQAEDLAQESAEAEALSEEDPLQDASNSELDAQLDAELADVFAEGENIDSDPGAATTVDAQRDGTSADSDAELQLAERTEDLQRVSAEYANYRRRTERERASVAVAAKGKIIEELLPLVDDLELAKQHGDLAEGPLKSFSEKLQSVLTSQGAEAFGAEGDPFDPEIHEAVQDLSQGEEKVIGTVLRKGYRVSGRLVRNAMVIIADPADQAESTASAESTESTGPAASTDSPKTGATDKAGQPE